jgi:hypothetical protein
MSVFISASHDESTLDRPHVACGNNELNRISGALVKTTENRQARE